MQDEITKLEIAMRAKVGLCWVQTPEEVRIERAITEIAKELKYDVVMWTSTKGIVDAEGEVQNSATRDPAVAMEALLEMTGRITAIFFDLGIWLQDPMNMRTARDVHRALTTLEKENAKQIIVVDVKEPPEGLIGVSVVEWSMPDRNTMENVLDAVLTWAPPKAKKKVKENDNRGKIISALLGLTTEDAASALSRSLAACGTFDPMIIAKEKERVVKGSGLEWHDPDPRGFEGIGGLDVLKEWLVQRRVGFTQKARDYGLAAPKGALLLGVPGCGKSLICKCIASAWSLPLLRMDIGALFSKYVGESEGKMRKALNTAEAVSPCVMWLN